MASPPARDRNSMSLTTTPACSTLQRDGVAAEMVESVQIKVDDAHTVSGLLQLPDRPIACLVLAHGAGAGMDHPFMAAVAEGLHARRIATLRYQFPYVERGLKRPDQPPLAQRTVRAAVRAGGQLAPGLPAFAGGKSFGGRMTSQAQAEDPLPEIRGLVFLGFPLHPANRPSPARAEHLFRVRVPMLFVQGTRDKLADMALLTALIGRLGPDTIFKPIDDADHSFHCPARSGRQDAQVLDEVSDAAAGWMARITHGAHETAATRQVFPQASHPDRSV